VFTHFSRCVAADEFVVDLLGFGSQLGGGLGAPVLLTGEVERNVLLAELRHKESCEGTQAIYR